MKSFSKIYSRLVDLNCIEETLVPHNLVFAMFAAIRASVKVNSPPIDVMLVAIPQVEVYL